MTSLAMMSFLAAGHTPDVGLHGGVVRNATDFLVAQTPADGYFGKLDGSRMYGHGITTLALAEVAGVEPDAKRREKILAAVASAVRVILAAQDIDKAATPIAGGGAMSPSRATAICRCLVGTYWRCGPRRTSASRCPSERVARAVAYVLKCYRKEEKAFAYQPGQVVSVAMTGVAMLNLYLLDAAQRPELTGAGQYLAKTQVTENMRSRPTRPIMRPRPRSGRVARRGRPYWPPTMDRLLAVQMDDGGWPASKTGEEPGRAL